MCICGPILFPSKGLSTIKVSFTDTRESILLQLMMTEVYNQSVYQGRLHSSANTMIVRLHLHVKVRNK